MDSGIYIAIAAGFIVWLSLFFYTRRLKKGKKYGNAITIDKQQIAAKWQEIENTFNMGGNSRLKSAIMEADKLADFVLKAKGVAGNTMGERMKNARNKFGNYDDYNNLWFAHKVRNNIAHETMHDLSFAEAKKAMEYFKKALKELGVL